MKRIEFRYFLALIIFSLFLTDVFYKIFILHAFYRIFWYSTLGLFFISIALILKNNFISTACVVALFLVESIWTIGFFYSLVTHNQILSLSSSTFAISWGNYYSLSFVFYSLIGFYVPRSKKDKS